MPRKEDEPITRRHIFIYDADWEKLQALFGTTTGVSKAMRLIIRQFLKNAENKAMADSPLLRSPDHAATADLPDPIPGAGRQPA